MSEKVAVIGLDCLPPELIFDRWLPMLPNMRSLVDHGLWGRLESTIPPITVPAWMCMMTGKDPGELGIYGFRNRRDFSYDGLSFPSYRSITAETLWDVLGRNGKRSLLLGIPLTYPPKKIHGEMVSCFMTPNREVEFTYPAELKREIAATVGEYLFDVRDSRTDDKDRLLNDIQTMTQKRFELAEHLVKNHPWDFFMMVEMGTDRIHHGFWKFFDDQHPKYVAGNPYENAIRDYYIRLDELIGKLINCFGKETIVYVISDHGAKRMEGGICLNQWLIENGYLTLKTNPETITRFSVDMVDWETTRAWGDGGYYGRLFLNVKGREPSGTVSSDQYENVLNKLAAQLEALGDELGRPIGTKVYAPKAVYKAARNVAPDLIVYFGDLNWRSVGSIGHPSIWTHENDTGPDDANHSQHGVFIRCSNRLAPSEKREGLSIYDVAPTILQDFNLEVPPGMGRHAVTNDGDTIYSEEEEAEIARRLEDLGYL
ncbi:MAG: alkaline phosphatase family protein [Armatimonadetes bacterium]|nr:alkaline phosphatase family protein [Armatimonadota bacterium]